ncbi:hypothetical protein, partial [Helicobacter typhlonius]
KILLHKGEIMVSKSLLFGTLLGAVLLAGCSNNVARFSVATTGSLPVKMEKTDKTVKGKDCITSILFWDVGNTQNRISGAVANALDVAAKQGLPSDALQNVNISYSTWSVVLFGRNCYTATGQPVTVK